mmetsp:Transcript_36593/g.92042  ORF Transcript_36593/g.92042 Transcript_36593/m.92042 type:complete len:367 (-) Transcript_36593:299-1399(-)|eukprot:CAMPEP_0173429730 /NCGR_PEP_ID=MMETSP1357-20121228/8351_1 /TAXON_ID=77926 /ORGANISM="Hemiselmis rufescens, Strain PCC563" /LENGTH=366 /DNA_ID=CAMNT_0014393955 /DNA_START=206 /DNA_END=1306 /DNA_ORIENTATION=+
MGTAFAAFSSIITPIFDLVGAFTEGVGWVLLKIKGMLGFSPELPSDLAGQVAHQTAEEGALTAVGMTAGIANAIGEEKALEKLAGPEDEEEEEGQTDDEDEGEDGKKKDDNKSQEDEDESRAGGLQSLTSVKVFTTDAEDVGSGGDSKGNPRSGKYFPTRGNPMEPTQSASRPSTALVIMNRIRSAQESFKPQGQSDSDDGTIYGWHAASRNTPTPKPRSAEANLPPRSHIPQHLLAGDDVSGGKSLPASLRRNGKASLASRSDIGFTPLSAWASPLSTRIQRRASQQGSGSAIARVAPDDTILLDQGRVSPMPARLRPEGKKTAWGASEAGAESSESHSQSAASGNSPRAWANRVAPDQPSGASE